MTTKPSIFETLNLLQQAAKRHWESLKIDVVCYSVGNPEQLEQLNAFQKLESDLKSVISKYFSYLESEKKTLEELTSDEWNAVDLAYTINCNYLENVLKNMRLHSVSNKITANVEADIAETYKNVNAVKMFFMGK